VVLAYSGGLDTSFCVVWLREHGYRVTTVTVDTGGFAADELSRIERLSQELGAASHVTVDARAGLFDRYLRYLVFGNVLRGGAYPLSVSAERVCQAERVVAILRRACEYRAVKVENTQLKQEIRRRDKTTAIARPIGKSKRFLDVLKLAEHMGTSIGEFAESTFLYEAACNPDPVLRLTGVNRALEGLAIDVFNTMREFGEVSGDPVLAFCEDWMLADEVTHVKMGSDWLRRLTGPRRISCLNTAGRQWATTSGFGFGERRTRLLALSTALRGRSRDTNSSCSAISSGEPRSPSAPTSPKGAAGTATASCTAF
jgi:hypothetical protein